MNGSPWSPRSAAAPSGAGRHGHEGGVGMHEVKRGPGSSPASSRDPARASPCSSPCAAAPARPAGSPCPATRRSPGCARRARRRLEHHLHAHADAQHRARPGQPAVDDQVAADRAQAGHAGGERADPRHDQAVASSAAAKSAVTSGPRRPGPGPAGRTAGCPSRNRGRRPGAGSRSQHALRARHPARPRIGGGRGAQRAGHRLELRLHDVVRVAAGQLQVQADPAAVVRDSKKWRVSVVSNVPISGGIRSGSRCTR